MKMLSNERGAMNVLLIPVILLAVLFIAAASFAVWAYGGRQDYKNNVDSKIAAAVATNKTQVQAADAKAYAEAAKNPLTLYSGPAAYGSVQVHYPKTWSAYVDTTDESNPLDAFFYPNAVPSINSSTAVYALRVEVANQAYSDVVNQLSTQGGEGPAPVMKPYKLPKVPGVVGMKVDGSLNIQSGANSNIVGSMVVLPVRDKTLMIWTESKAFYPDFNKYVLPNFTFSP